MFSLQDANIHNIAIEGVFDDCQDIVKAVSNDLEFKRKYKHRHRQLDQLGAPGGAGRVLLRRLLPGHDAQRPRRSSFTVPSGNFGNICAGHVARMMGLPIDKLVLATNENDVLDEFFRTGVYRVRGSAETHETSSPSMDIRKATNFERFVFDLLGRDGARTQALFGDAAGARGPLRPERATRHSRRPRSATASSAARARTPTAWRPSATPTQRFGVMIDTHTADGLKVAREHLRARRADDRAGDGAAGQVRRDHRRGAGPRARAPGAASKASRTCPSASRAWRPSW